ncbi:MAG TPA: hypothetical protein VH619_11570 [Verrucomicrobiae bacterium]|nr:hypothetical protein [Verrucomicrobiae bacterium]
MREAVIIRQFQRRLVEIGCPTMWMRETVREFADHYEDLKQAAMEEGLQERDAEARAQMRLGDSILLAEQTVAVLRRSTWWGRHPVIGFFILPLFALAPAWAACGAVLAGICWLLGQICGPGYSVDRQTAHALASDPNAFQSFAGPVNNGLMFSATVLVTLTFLWLARRSALGLKWKLIACAVCSFNSIITYASIDPGSVLIGYGWPSQNWIYTVIPLLAAISVYFQQRKMENCLPPGFEN